MQALMTGASINHLLDILHENVFEEGKSGGWVGGARAMNMNNN